MKNLILGIGLASVLTVGCQNNKDDKKEDAATTPSEGWASKESKTTPEKNLLTCRQKVSDGVYTYYTLKSGAKAVSEMEVKDSTDKTKIYEDAIFSVESYIVKGTDKSTKVLAQFPVYAEVTPTSATKETLVSTSATVDTVKLTSDKSKTVPAEFQDLKEKDPVFAIAVSEDFKTGVSKLTAKLPEGVVQGTKLECADPATGGVDTKNAAPAIAPTAKKKS